MNLKQINFLIRGLKQYIFNEKNDLHNDLYTEITEHNSSNESHSDIRTLIANLTTKLNTLADSDDETLDQLSEIVTYIKNNKSLIDGVTTSKVNVSDIIDNLTTETTNKPLSAKQGKILKGLIDAITVPTKVSELTNDSKFLTTIPDEYITETELTSKGYLTEHQSLKGYATETYVNNKIPQLSFNDNGELIVTINGVSKTFVPKSE